MTATGKRASSRNAGTMRYVPLLGVLPLALAASAQAQEVPASVQFRFVVDCGAEGASPPVHDEKNTGSYCLADRVVVSEKSIERAEVTKDAAGAAAVMLVLTDKAAERLFRATQSQVGNRLGVIINSRLVIAPIIREPIGKEFVLVGQMAQDKAEALVRSLNRPPPPAK
jgi:preprotein translocase subunit SecD